MSEVESIGDYSSSDQEIQPNNEYLTMDEADAQIEKLRNHIKEVVGADSRRTPNDDLHRDSMMSSQDTPKIMPTKIH